jgi:hypothetical protein
MMREVAISGSPDRGHPIIPVGRDAKWPYRNRENWLSPPRASQVTMAA